jgi:hypothetical protein
MCSAGWKRFAKMYGAHEKDASTYTIYRPTKKSPSIHWSWASSSSSFFLLLLFRVIVVTQKKIVGFASLLN